MSKETDAIVQYLKDSGVPHRVTAVLGTWVSAANPCSPHTAGSNHCGEGTNGKGLAVDFGGATPGTSADAIQQMGAIFNAFRPVAPQLAELFHNGPGIDKVIKDGVWRSGFATLGPKTWAQHRDHIHVAVRKGVFLSWPRTQPKIASVETPTKKVLPLFEPPIQTEPIVADLACPTGGAWCLAASGAVYGWGGAPHLGAPNGKDYFAGRKAARLEPVDGKYRVVAESGETYGPGF